MPQDVYGVSVITEMELLSWPSLTEAEEAKVRGFLNGVKRMELTAPVRRQAIHIRRHHRLKLPDAIICATAMDAGVTLWTNDTQLAQVDGLRCRSVILAPGN